MRKVRILLPHWTEGELDDPIPDTPWFNVWVTTARGERIRLLLTAEEFVPY